MKLEINFDKGIYSTNKDEIKKVFKILDYKYAGSKIINDKQMICIWKRNKQIIKAIFNGSGEACSFIVDCNEEETNVFKSFTSSYNAQVKEFVPVQIDNNLLETKAKENVDKWFTLPTQLKGEPQLFYERRIQKAHASYKEFVKKEMEKMTNEN